MNTADQRSSCVDTGGYPNRVRNLWEKELHELVMCRLDTDTALNELLAFPPEQLEGMLGAPVTTSLAGSDDRGHIYRVEPTGPFKDDPNVTDKKFPNNPTRSYRTRDALRIVGKIESWEGHSPEVLQAMLDGLARLREQGLRVIYD